MPPSQPVSTNGQSVNDLSKAMSALEVNAQISKAVAPMANEPPGPSNGLATLLANSYSFTALPVNDKASQSDKKTSVCYLCFTKTCGLRNAN
jgi:hypothetical protein